MYYSCLGCGSRFAQDRKEDISFDRILKMRIKKIASQEIVLTKKRIFDILIKAFIKL